MNDKKCCPNCGSMMKYEEFGIPDKNTGETGLVKGHQCPYCPTWIPILEAPPSMSEKTIVDILIENDIHPIDLLEDLALTLDGPPGYDSMRKLADLLEKDGVKIPPRGPHGKKMYPESVEDYSKWRSSHK